MNLLYIADQDHQRWVNPPHKGYSTENGATIQEIEKKKSQKLKSFQKLLE